MAARDTTGITVRHGKNCSLLTPGGKKCSCTPSYRAVFSDKGAPRKGEARKRSGEVHRKTFATMEAALRWRRDMEHARDRGERLSKDTTITLRQAAEEWLAGATAEPPTVRRIPSGEAYKPSVPRSYELNLRLHVYDDLGGRPLSEITLDDLLTHVTRLQGKGLGKSTIRNVFMPIRAIYRWAMVYGVPVRDEDGNELRRERVAENPTTAFVLPPGFDTVRDRVAGPEEARELLAALDDRIRPIYATALYAGLRLGELRALRWRDVDLATGKLTVRAGWDAKDGEIAPKSERGKRRVPLRPILREELAALKARSRAGREDDREDDFVFPSPRDPRAPFTPTNVNKRAAGMWAAENARRVQEAEERGDGLRPRLLTPIGLHECRHTAASYWIAAGLRILAVSRYMGHASITTTNDLYGHLLPDADEESLALMEAYDARSDTAGRIAELEAGRAEE